jgi:hypothetical protein
MRPTTAALAAGALAALIGCGKGTPTKPDDKPAGDKGGPPSSGTPSQPGTAPSAGAGPAVLRPNDPAQEAVTRFVTDLRAAAEKTDPFPPAVMDRVSPAFLKVIGKPVRTDADKQRGYSASEAEAWLRRAGVALNGIGLPTGYGSPAAAVFVGSFGNGVGRVLIRTVPADGGWKVDWFQLGTAKTDDWKPATGDAPFQDFAVQAFADALTGNATSKGDRELLLGAVLSPKLRHEWAEPFAQDKERGYDYNATKLGELIDKLGGGATAYTRAPAGADRFKLELTKGGKPEAHTLKLVKGAAGDWQVDEFTQK